MSPLQKYMAAAVSCFIAAALSIPAPAALASPSVIDTTWYGFLPGGTTSKVGAGGRWDFDKSVSNTQIPNPGAGTTTGSGPTLTWTPSANGLAALQGWTPALSEVQLQAYDPDAAACEPDTYLNYGNKGAYWGQKNMTTVPDKTGGFTNTNIAGSGSLWCGVAQPAASSTFGEFEGSEGIQCAVNFPGYANLWDQLVWKDIAINAGGTTMTFSYRVDMDTRTEPGSALGGCAGTPPMQNGSVKDRLDVYAGNPTGGTPTANYELSDLISSTLQLSPAGGYTGHTSATVTTATFGGGVGGIGSSGRIVFRVRTNRSNSDQSGTVSFDGGATTQAGSDYGAAVLDDIYFSNASGKTGGVVDPTGSNGHNLASRYQFESTNQGWVSSAKQLPLWVHIINVGNNDPGVSGLGYDPADPENKWADPCGVPGSAALTCNLVNNVMASFNPIIEGGHKDHYAVNYWPVCCPRGETCQGAISPDIDLTSNGTTPLGYTGALVQFDAYTYNPSGDGVVYQTFVRYKTLPGQGCPNYTSWRWNNSRATSPYAHCAVITQDLSGLAPWSTATHAQVFLTTTSFCWSLGPAGSSGTCQGNFSPLFDNVRFGGTSGTPPAACPSDEWCAIATGGPAARDGAVMVTDDARGSIVLFGGAGASGDLGDTWEFTGDDLFGWVCLAGSGSGPAPRHGHAMAYDRARGKVVLYGGSVGGLSSSDTWEWDAGVWTFHPTGGPGPRYGQCMAYDENLHKVVMFGGFNGNSMLGDTWAWDGIGWQLLANTGPSPRMNAAMATDPERKRIVLYGGSVTNSAAGAQGDTWEWDGIGWLQSPATGPARLWRHGMAYASPCDRMFLNGGETFAAVLSGATWAFDGFKWQIAPTGPAVASHAMAYDFPQARIAFFGGSTGGGRSRSTWTRRCPCDDEAAELDSLDNVIFPATLDPDEPVTYDDVSEDDGDISVLYPGYHTSADTWLKDFPCATAIGGTIPDDAAEPPIADSLAALGINASPEEIVDSMASWENQILAMYQNEPDSLPMAPPVGNGPYVAPVVPYCPPDSGSYVFGGRDLIFIHGLQLDHVFDAVKGVEGSRAVWHTPGTFPARFANPEFYDTLHYYRKVADENWAPHIERFLTSHHYKNRYLIVPYPCNARMQVIIQAILTQISDAMRFGTNVRNPQAPDTLKFGTPSFVIVSHSTGGLAVDASMYAARTDANLNAAFIPQRCKAHVAFAGAFGGSRLATAGLVVSGVLSSTTGWIKPLFQNVAEWFGNDPGLDDPMLLSVAANSVMVDLVPLVAKHHWANSVENANVPTITVTGAHPTYVWPLKHLLNPGFDDGVLNVNCTSPNDASPLLWANGFVTTSLKKTYDMGMAHDDPFTYRAKRYYADQVKDGILSSPATYLIPHYVAAGPITDLSPWGMLESVGIRFGDAFDPMRRFSHHYSFMSCASDHINIRSAANWPNYRPAFGDVRCWEEARTIREEDEPTLRATYFPGPVAYSGDDQPLLTAACTPTVDDFVKGRRVNFKIKVYSGKKYPKHWWIWKRHYMQPPTSDGKHVADFVYGSILACGTPINGCPTSVGAQTNPILQWSAASRPNPFSGPLTIEFTLPRGGPVDLRVYDLRGRLVRRLLGESMPAGAHSLKWDGLNDSGMRVASGTYFWKMKTGENEVRRQVTLIR